jgi:hypothetical protein
MFIWLFVRAITTHLLGELLRLVCSHAGKAAAYSKAMPVMANTGIANSKSSLPSPFQ